MDKFTKLFPVHFSGAPYEEPQDYLDRCHEMTGSTKRFWKDFVLAIPAWSPALTWDQLSLLFLEKLLPIKLREEHCRQFERLQQGSMTVTQYETHFMDLARHALLLLPNERGRVRRFIDRLAQPIRLQMAKETVSEISFQVATNVARRVEMVLAQGGQGSDKRPRHSGGFNGASSGGKGTFGIGYPPRPFHSALQASPGALGGRGPRMPYSD
ncbi:uncharacterized protein [Nicotiana tomentosiformis]|uniref:uncharacterized protein n=1 Tax=Nicotiana tomentosiformis TaxID=4098 RepID=UPI00388CD93A